MSLLAKILIKELESAFIYEVQHIIEHVHESGSVIFVEKAYFKSHELEAFIDRGLLEGDNKKDLAVLYAAMMALDGFAKDFRNHPDKPRYELDENNIANIERLVVEYKELFIEIRNDHRKKLPEIMGFKK